MKGIYSKDLPEEYKKYVHSDFIANEKQYWRKRKELLRKYRGRWVAIHDETVVADSDDIWEITEAVGKLGCHAYIARVGEEENLVFNVRRLALRRIER